MNIDIESRPNPLAESGKPLFFPVADVTALGFTAPPARLGEAVRLSVRSLAGMQKEALVVSARTGAAWRLTSDEGAYLAGLDAAPCPLSFLTVGMVSATMNEIRALAAARRIELEGIRLIQDNYYTMSGSALRGTMTGGARNVDLTAQIASSADRDMLGRLVHDALAASPASGLMHGVKRSLFTLTHNGREIAPGRVGRLDGPAAADPADSFDLARPATGDWTGLIRRGGPSPRVEHTVTLANDSLAEEQHRLLHVRGICALGEDGVKRIEQQLFNPHGSTFHYLCDEAPVNGGQGLAPDAASYISAGIGFCFMTQFGRYAAIARRNLRSYRILQDTHFSLGGASGGAGNTGEADPVETHVFLETGEDDEFARTLLDMAEQTCFLHAFCRTDLETRISIETYSDRAPLPVARPA